MGVGTRRNFRSEKLFCLNVFDGFAAGKIYVPLWQPRIYKAFHIVAWQQKSEKSTCRGTFGNARNLTVFCRSKGTLGGTFIKIGVKNTKKFYP